MWSRFFADQKKSAGSNLGFFAETAFRSQQNLIPDQISNQTISCLLVVMAPLIVLLWLLSLERQLERARKVAAQPTATKKPRFCCAILPSGSNGWTRLAQEYASQALDRKWPLRDEDSLKNKFKALKNSPKPTGDPDCPWDVKLAKRLQREIDASRDVVGFDFEDGEEENMEEAKEDDDEEYVEENEPRSIRSWMIWQLPARNLLLYYKCSC